MRYMVMLSMRSDVGAPPPELMEAMDTAMGEAFASGLMIDAGGLMPMPDSTQLDDPGGRPVADRRPVRRGQGGRRRVRRPRRPLPRGGGRGCAPDDAGPPRPLAGLGRVGRGTADRRARGRSAAVVTRVATHEAVVAVWQLESARVVAGPARMTRDLKLAEDLAQDALVAALEYVAARRRTRQPRRLADDGRQAPGRSTRSAGPSGTARRSGASATTFGDLHGELVDQVDHVEDDVLRLMFLTCHPALTPESRAALTLRLVGGLTVEEIARGFLVKDTAVGQRISRAKRTLAEAGATLDMPIGAERAERLDDVMAVIYLVFNEGYAATAGRRGCARTSASRRCGSRGCWSRWPVGDAEVHGLQALLELQASRFHARTRPDGEPILLEDQDRARWDHLFVRRGLAALDRAESLGRARRGLHRAGRHRRLPCPRPPRRGHRLGAYRRALRPALVGRRQPGRRGQPGRRPRARLRSRRRPRGARRGRRRGRVAGTSATSGTPSAATYSPAPARRRGRRGVPHRRLPHPQRRRAFAAPRPRQPRGSPGRSCRPEPRLTGNAQGRPRRDGESGVDALAPEGVAAAGVDLGGGDVEAVEAEVAVRRQLLDRRTARPPLSTWAKARGISASRSASGTSTAVPVRYDGTVLRRRRRGVEDHGVDPWVGGDVARVLGLRRGHPVERAVLVVVEVHRRDPRLTVRVRRAEHEVAVGRDHVARHRGQLGGVLAGDGELRSVMLHSTACGPGLIGRPVGRRSLTSAHGPLPRALPRHRRTPAATSRPSGRRCPEAVRRPRRPAVPPTSSATMSSTASPSARLPSPRR